MMKHTTLKKQLMAGILSMLVAVGICVGVAADHYTTVNTAMEELAAATVADDIDGWEEAQTEEGEVYLPDAEVPLGSNSTVTIKKLCPKASSTVRNVFEQLGFTVKIKGSVSYQGEMDAAARTITLKTANSDNCYHELGHFVAFIAGNADKTSSFQAIYKAEKKKYTGRNKTYVTKNASEYFAESYREYILKNSTLKKQRPKTYKAIKAAIALVTPARATTLQKVYRAVWSR